MLKKWRTQYCKNVNSPQADLYFQRNFNQINNWTFTEIDQLVLKLIHKCKKPRITKRKKIL